MPAGAVLEARGLYHIYRGPEVETVALRGAELALREGSWSSVMGPSGSGKSTLRPRPRRSGRAERRVGGGRRRRPHPPLAPGAGALAPPLRGRRPPAQQPASRARRGRQRCPPAAAGRLAGQPGPGQGRRAARVRRVGRPAPAPGRAAVGRRRPRRSCSPARASKRWPATPRACWSPPRSPTGSS